MIALLTGALCLLPAAQAQAPAGDVVQITAELRRGDKGFYLAVRADVAADYHIYSLTQPPPVLKTTIKINENMQVKVGDFTANPAPKVVEKDKQKFEEHHGAVEWTAPLEIAEGVDAADLTVEGSVRYQACKDDSCLFPKTVKFTAKPVRGKERLRVLPMSGPPSLPGVNSTSEGYQAAGSHTRLTGRIVPGAAKPGDTVHVEITFSPSAAEGYHLYGLAEKNENKGSYRPLLVSLDQAGGGAPQPGRINQQWKEVSSKSGETAPQYHGPVTVWIPVKLPADADGATTISGVTGYQSCFEDPATNQGSCDMPLGARFSGVVMVSAQPDAAAASAPLAFKRASYTEVDKIGRTPEVFNLARAVEIGAPTLPAAVARPARAAASLSGNYQAAGSHTQLTGRIVPAAAKPGETVFIEITITPSAAEDYHLYGLAEKNENKPGYMPLLVVLDQTGGAAPQPGRVSQQWKEVFSAGAGQKTPQYHGAATVWIPLVVPADAAGEIALSGAVGFQSCNSENCDRPLGARFSGSVAVSAKPEATAAASTAPLTFKSTSYSEVNKLAQKPEVFNLARGVEIGAPERIAAAAPSVPAVVGPAIPGGGDAARAAPKQIEPATAPGPAPVGPPAAVSKEESAAALAAARRVYTRSDLLLNILVAFFGGGLMNFMPCVLPVIGLKVLSFAQQAKESRLRALALNVFYSVGIVAVFWVLAGLAVGYGLAWGQQFTKPAFVMSLAAVVWVMALSFLGVWEIPIPGFAMSDSAQALAAKEGFTGAFLKGIITTLLATPCGAPFMASAIAFTAGKPPEVVFAVFTAVGVGMAAPYLVLGMFPALAKLLPKPGAWMNTFKEFLGFVLLFTVAFLCSSLSRENMSIMFTIFVGLWMSCWILGRSPEDAPSFQRVGAWVLAAVPTAAVLAFCFIDVGGAKLDWQPYSEAKLAELRRQGKTVLVDFTADWCLNCKTVERFALNRVGTRRKIEQLGAVVLQADWTTESDEIVAALARHDSLSIPLTVIYPGGGGDAIVLRDIYQQDTLLDALEKAGPSRASPAPAVAGPSVARND